MICAMRRSKKKKEKRTFLHPFGENYDHVTRADNSCYRVVFGSTQL